MTKLTIELPKKLEKQLLAVAKQENLSLETFVLKLLTKLVSFYTKKEQDNLLNIQIIKTDSIRKNSLDQAKDLDFATLLEITQDTWKQEDGLVYQEKVRQEWS
ncbi:MAG: hypothetical protein WA865_07325 [Spirulinaceae cyanobacterium]